jgi:hypothetical protein
MILVRLEYRRIGNSMSSSGSIISNENGLITEEAEFDGIEFRKMMARLAGVLQRWPVEQAVDVDLVRLDHLGTGVYRLDTATVQLLRTDPVAAIATMEYPMASPSTTVQRLREERTSRACAPIPAGYVTLADAFGDQLYFRVRKHELECPGCGFWGMFISPGLLKSDERMGSVVKTAFVCPKKCGQRFVVSCDTEWGYVSTKYLLENTTLERFYFPRSWNEGQSWVSRVTLQHKYDEYQKEKDACSSKEP